MSFTLNLLNKTSKKYLFESKSFVNSLFFRNIYSFYLKNSSNELINELVLKNNKKKFKKLLITSKLCPKVCLIIDNKCLLSSQNLTFERMADKTLEHLNEELEAILEESIDLKDSDVSLNSGVLTMNLGNEGIYVINKQTPNQQIWLSSPISGPKRYDFINNDWIYKRDGNSLLNLLNSELSLILKREIIIKSISY